nr:hypothetical protein [Tanacetum cinerariifolium]
MAGVNVTAPADQAPTMAPPIHTDDQILPHIRWLDEQWFDLTKDTLRDAFQITPVNNNQAFTSPPSSDALIKFRALTTIINLCLTGKTSGFERPRAPVLRILWGVVNRAHLDYAERIWEEFTQSIHTFIEDKRNMARHAHGKKKATLIVIPNEFVAEDIPEKEPRVDDEEDDVQRALEESLKSMYVVPWGPLPPVVIREPESGKYQPLLESPADRYIFQRRTSAPTRSFGHDESSSLYAELGLTDSEGESDEDVPRTDAGIQGKGQAGLDPDAQDEGHAGSNPDERAEGQAGPDPDVSTQPPPEQMDERFTATAYLKVQEISSSQLKNIDKPSEADNDKATAETEAKSIVSVTIQQDTSSIPPMTTPIVDLTSRPESPKVHQLLKSTTIETTTTTIHPPSSQQQQSTTNSMMMKRINIPHQVSKAVYEVVTDAVDWAMQAPLRNRFRDLPEADMKEILHQRMWETNSYKTHEDHMQLYEALEKSMNHDHSEELAKDLAEACKKKKKRRDSPKTPLGSPPHQPPPPPPPASPSGASRSPRASGSSQVPPPPPPPPSTNQEGQSKGSAAPSSSKTATSAEYQAWTMTDTRLRPSISMTPADLQMDNDMTPDAQAQSSNDEDIRNAHIPKVNLQQDWWKPLEEERLATPKPAWSISSSDVPVPMNNWASALASTYSPPPEDSLLTQTGDIAMFMDWHNVSKPLPLGGPPGHVTIQSDFFFNKDLEYLRYGSKGSIPVLSILKIKATYYPDAGLEQMVPGQMWIEEECKYTSESDYRAVMTHMRILSVVRIEVFSMYGYGVQMIMRFNEIHKFSDGTLQQIDEALDYRVKEFKINRMNLGLNTRFWTRKDVDRSKEFMFAIQKRLKTRRIFCNMESFIGGRVRDGDYRLLKRTE